MALHFKAVFKMFSKYHWGTIPKHQARVPLIVDTFTIFYIQVPTNAYPIVFYLELLIGP